MGENDPGPTHPGGNARSSSSTPRCWTIRRDGRPSGCGDGDCHGTTGNRPFVGFGDAGWDHAPWEEEPCFSPDELDVLLDVTLTVAEAAARVGCVERDVVRLRQFV